MCYEITSSLTWGTEGVCRVYSYYVIINRVIYKMPCCSCWGQTRNRICHTGPFGVRIRLCGRQRRAVGTRVIGFPVFGNCQWLRQEALNSRIAVALGAGESRSRQLLAERCSRWGIEILTPVHPAATVARTVSCAALFTWAKAILASRYSRSAR